MNTVFNGVGFIGLGSAVKMVIMKLLKFVMFIFYRYYSKGGTRRIPYFSALCAVVFLIYILVFQALIIFDGVNLLPLSEGDTKPTKYFKLALFLIPVFLLIAYLVKEKDLRKADYEEGTLKRGSIYLIVYIITSFILLFALMLIFAPK